MAGRALLAAAMLASGAALVAAVVTGLPLSLTLVLLGTTAVLIVAARWSQVTPDEARHLRAQLLTGLIAGLAATLAYDVSRFLLVQIGRLPITPFETFNLFGRMIVGEGSGGTLTFAVGTAYHVLNGTAFAIGYCFLLGGRNWRWGIAWGLALEAAMLSLYPGWLNLDDVLVEFTTMSFVGHLCYGAVLGTISERRLGRNRAPRPDEADWG